MNKKLNIDAYQIKVNRISSEFIPYSKYIKNNYPQLNRFVPKNSILYKVKYRPELANNTYNQQSLNNIDISNNIKINFDDINNTNIKTLSREINETYQNIDNINYYNNCFSEKSLTNNNSVNKLNNGVSVPHSNINNHIDLEIKENKIIYGKIELPRNNRLNNDIYFCGKNNNSQSYSNFSTKTIDVKKKTENNEMKNKKTLNTSKYNKYHKNYSMGLIEFFNKGNTEALETSVESFSNKGNKVKKLILFSGKKAKKEEKINKNDKNFQKIEPKNDSVTFKMEIYRTKLFKEFFKYFRHFYKNYIKHHFNYFVEKIKIIKENKELNFINKTIDDYYGHKSKNLYILTNEKNNNEINIADMIKSSTTRNYYKNNENTKNKNILNVKNINLYKNNNKNIFKNLSLSLRNKQFVNKSSLRDKNPNNLSSLKRNKKEYESPSFSYKNKMIINKDISLGKESKNENDLFRDSRKLNKKYEQIQRRRKKFIIYNEDIAMFNNQSIDIYNTKNNDISNEFNEIRKYIQEIKKENEISNKRNTVNSEKPKKKFNKLIKINENSKKKNNKEMQKEEIKDKTKDINNKFKIMKVNINKNLLIKNNNSKKIMKHFKDNKKIIIYSHNKNNKSFQGNRNNIYYTKKPNNENKEFSIVIKNIKTKDNLAHIHINYYFLKRMKNPKKLRYNFLKISEPISINIINKNFLNVKLSSIKEEDTSIQNSKIYEDSDNFKYNDNKRILLVIQNIYNILIKLYKKNVFYRIKNYDLDSSKSNKIKYKEKNNIKKYNINVNNLNIKNNKFKKNIFTKIYSKKRGYKMNKKEGDIKSNKNLNENYTKKIDKFRNHLINYFISSNCKM